jgi:hypothetical protein
VGVEDSRWAKVAREFPPPTNWLRNQKIPGQLPNQVTPNVSARSDLRTWTKETLVIFDFAFDLNVIFVSNFNFTTSRMQCSQFAHQVAMLCISLLLLLSTTQ